MLKRKRLSSWRNRTLTLARARRPRWVDTLLIDSPSRTTQVEARGGRRESESRGRRSEVINFLTSNIRVVRYFSRSHQLEAREPERCSPI